MGLHLEAVTFDVTDVLSAACFWAGLLDREVVPEPGAVLLPGDQTQVGLRFRTSETGQPGRPGQAGRPRLHVHLTSSTLEDQQRSVATALRLGGRHLDVGQVGDEGFVVLADPEGNELCVIEPGNRYLAGTGHLGEITCDGRRAVGLFWRDALGWPLVWDEGEQTAIQSPLGGTKIAWDAWDGSTADPRQGRDRQRFDLVSADPAADVDRLLALGAVLLAQRPGLARLADPGGNEFGVRLDQASTA